LVPESQRSGGHGGDLVVAVDPPTQALGTAEYIEGRWMYGGNWINQFGHFVTETLTNLWPNDPKVQGVLFHPFIFGGEPTTWQLRLLTRAEWRSPIRIIRGPCVVESLIVPSRPFTTNLFAAPEAVLVWDRVSSVGRPSRLVFLTRTGLDHDVRRLAGDDDLDEAMRLMGFDVIHPERLTIDEQLTVIASASVLAGVSGSALHLSAFAPATTRVIEIGDQRVGGAPLPNQLVIDAARGRLTAFVPLTRSGNGRNLGATMDCVSDLLFPLW
jgi:capsular polysaccharide biosynthesis protein